MSRSIGFHRVPISSVLKFIFVLNMIQGFLSDYLGLSTLNYLCDALLLACVLLRLMHSSTIRISRKKPFPALRIVMACLLVVVALGWIYHSAPVVLGIWGLRNYGRMFVYFYLCSGFLDKQDYEDLVMFLIRFFPFQMGFMAFQVIVEGLSYDYLGGFFGKKQGCASGLMIYFLLMTVIVLVFYDGKRIGFSKVVGYYGCMLLFAAIAELKAFFVAFIVLIAIYILLTRHKSKAAVIAACGAIGVAIGIQILFIYFPNYIETFNLASIIASLTNKEASYTYREGLDIGRSSIFYKLTPVITRWGGASSPWIGIGLGNGEYSSNFTFLQSPFYLAYSQSNYMFFSLAFLFVELGYLGIIFYVGFFVVLGLYFLNKFRSEQSMANLLALFLPIICAFLIYYNASLRTSFGYIIFGLLGASLHADKTLFCDGASKT